MKVLILSANTFAFSPAGPAYIAGAVREAGHQVEVFDCFVSANPLRELETCLNTFQPDVIGISIRTVAGKITDPNAELQTTRFDARILVKQLAEVIRCTSSAHIVVGGPGFNYYGREWLEYLDLDYGLRGEAEFSFPLYLKRLEEGGDIYDIPGCVFRKGSDILKVPRPHISNLDDTALPAYELFDLEHYAEKKIATGIFTKRGCAFRCTFCPYSSLEGTRYRLKSPARVVDEIVHIQQTGPVAQFDFCDNSFNVPKAHAEAICREIVTRNLEIAWSTGGLKPIGITDDMCRLFKNSGCTGLGLAAESASETMLKRMHRGYRAEQVRQALSCLSRSGIPHGVSVLIGAPGETPDTISETFAVIDSFPSLSWLWVSIGLNLWTHHQPVLEDARRDGQLRNGDNLFDEVNYISPELPKAYMLELIASLKQRNNCYFQVNKLCAE